MDVILDQLHRAADPLPMGVHKLTVQLPVVFEKCPMKTDDEILEELISVGREALKKFRLRKQKQDEDSAGKEASQEVHQGAAETDGKEERAETKEGDLEEQIELRRCRE